MFQSKQYADNCAVELPGNDHVSLELETRTEQSTDEGEDYASLIAFFLQLFERAHVLLADPQSRESFVWYTRSEIKRVIVEVTKAAQDHWRRLHSNSRAFFSRLLALTQDPTGLVPLIIDYALLVRSFWSNRQVGPKVVYPMQCIKERQPGPLVNLVLDHCRAVRQYQHIGEATFPLGVDPPCVAVIDLDQVAHPIAQNEYSAQVDFYGHACLLIILTLIVDVLYSADWSDFHRWTTCATHSLVFFVLAVSRGEGTLKLAWKSNASSAPGCAVLLDQDFAVILTGSESALEAIAEIGFSHPHYDYAPRDLFMSLPIYLLCQGLLLYPALPLKQLMTKTLLSFIAVIISDVARNTHSDSLRTRTAVKNERHGLVVFIALMLAMEISLLRLHSVKLIHMIPYAVFPSFLLLSKYKLRNYPIRTAKFLDALWRPRVMKWQFDTLAAVATFHCLVLCHGIARPVESVDVLAYLNMLVPDQRDVWKPWKERVADRIVHETDISFAPTVPTFGDARQVHLRDLLNEAQSGYTAYMRFYDGSGGGSTNDASVTHAGHLDALTSDLERILNCMVIAIITSTLLFVPSQ